MSKKKDSGLFMTWLCVLIAFASPFIGLAFSPKGLGNWLIFGMFVFAFILPILCMVFYTKAGED